MGIANSQASETLFHRRKKLLDRMKEQKVLHLMVLPSLILVLLFKYIPMAGTITAFKRYDIFEGIFRSPWAQNYGFEHFIDLFRDPNFPVIIKNTLILAAMNLIAATLPPMMLAIMFNEMKSVRFKKINQTITYLPHFLSWAVLGGIFYNLFSPNNGPVNSLLLKAGIIEKPVEFLYIPEIFRPFVVLANMWKEMGWDSIIYLAVITGIDMCLFEAIEIDGGGRWAKIRHVIWPALKGTFVVLFIMKVGRMVTGNQDMFDQCYIMGNYATNSAAEILGLENARYSFAAAGGVFKAVVNITVLMCANAICKKLTDKSLF